MELRHYQRFSSKIIGFHGTEGLHKPVYFSVMQYFGFINIDRICILDSCHYLSFHGFKDLKPTLKWSKSGFWLVVTIYGVLVAFQALWPYFPKCTLNPIQNDFSKRPTNLWHPFISNDTSISSVLEIYIGKLPKGCGCIVVSFANESGMKNCLE